MRGTSSVALARVLGCATAEDATSHAVVFILRPIAKCATPALPGAVRNKSKRCAQPRTRNRKRREDLNAEWARKGLAQEEIQDGAIARRQAEIMKQHRELVMMGKQAEERAARVQEECNVRLDDI